MTNTPKVGIIMGSISDAPVMQDAMEILDQFTIPYEKHVVSAHRTPEKMVTYAQQAAEKGLQVIIAGAGGAAHLPGMTASLTSLPVIGVPIKTSTLSGLDSLYSIVQMPGSVPVATMAINGAKNAGLFAIKILALHDSSLQAQLAAYQTTLQKLVDDMEQELQKS